MKFKLYTQNNNITTIITSYNDEPNDVLESTYNEKLSLGENDQCTLTFSITKYINGLTKEENPYLQYIIFGQTLYLELPKRTIELVITSIAPQISSSNVVYNVTCQDIFSYKLQRIKLGYSYSTVEKGELQTVYEIADTVFKEVRISSRWKTNIYNDPELINNKLLVSKITLQVENSNPYNVIVEALNSVNAAMLVNYNNHTIHFYQKDAVLFSGYRYRPEVNLRTLSATFSIDELTTIMHVTGGTDEYGNPVMLVPPMPDAIKLFLDKKPSYDPSAQGYSDILSSDDFGYTTTEADGIDIHQAEITEVNNFCTIADRVRSLGQFLYDFSFFRRNGLMTEQQYNDIIDIIENKMSAINKLLRPMVQDYYTLDWDINKALTDITVPLEAINADFAEIKNIILTSADDSSDEKEEINDMLTDITGLSKQSNKIITTRVLNEYIRLYCRSLTLYNGHLVPEISAIVERIKYFNNMREDAYVWYRKKQIKYYDAYNKFYEVNNPEAEEIEETDIDPDRIQLESDISYYYERYHLAIQMVGAANNLGDIYCAVGGYPINVDLLQLGENKEYVWQPANVVPQVPTSADDIVFNPTITSDIYYVPCYYSNLYNAFQRKILGDSVQVVTGFPISGQVVPPLGVTLQRNVVLPQIICAPDESSSDTITYTLSQNQLLSEAMEEELTLPFTFAKSIVQLNGVENCSLNSVVPIVTVLNNSATGFVIDSITTRYDTTNKSFEINLHYSWDRTVPKFAVAITLDYNLALELNATFIISGSSLRSSLYYQIDDCNFKLRELWGTLYNKYGQFIYETQYENSDEVNSVALYNQAITYFENYRKPKSSYSISIINPRDLEQIGTPYLRINSRIRIYNDDLNLKEGEMYEQDENYTDDKAELNNISYTTNEVVITGINYDLRKSEEASITVERIIPYQNILQKLIKQVK